MIKLSALHGFLGSAHDWNFLDGQLNDASLDKEDLFSNGQTSYGETLWEFGAAFNRKAALMDAKTPVLMGYSLGGRLALHALLKKPDYWKAAIIISAHTGLNDEKLKALRKESDASFNELLQNKPWDAFISKWNSQEVFKNTPTLHREESHFDKKLLGKGFLEWSLSRQEDLKNRIESLNIPFFWIAGEKDAKFCELAKSLNFKHPDSTLWIAEQSGHRVPWQIQPEFISKINQFLDVIR